LAVLELINYSHSYSTFWLKPSLKDLFLHGALELVILQFIWCSLIEWWIMIHKILSCNLKVPFFCWLFTIHVDFSSLGCLDAWWSEDLRKKCRKWLSKVVSEKRDSSFMNGSIHHRAHPWHRVAFFREMVHIMCQENKRITDINLASIKKRFSRAKRKKRKGTKKTKTNSTSNKNKFIQFVISTRRLCWWNH
jgi:hypothetical protein